ncbi:MAG: mannose-6-phosphate isomerase, class I [Candidatus Cloacimonas sp.]|nr:mannose-6-phosphate isomerase, class I [Candidatus Cloacimonas sp.]HNS83811.1 mannose-6-phosphate isomerase, class I [Candidatus Cloacimonas sp.]HQP32504.1 mannose-6-phosphate isomerase, class I [Candidatus Cloacimonas sp.]
MPYLIKPSLQNYSWGDTKYLQELIGEQQEIGKPLAEIWFGAHPKAPSLVITEKGEIPMNKLLQDMPENMLGTKQNITLPFLLKILAAAEPLSLQVHPDKQTAQNGFRQEEQEGIPLTDLKRSFKDPNHKPELICALTPFIAMCGFRPFEEIIRNFLILGIAEIWQKFSAFNKNPSKNTLKDLFSQILESDSSQLQEFMHILESKQPELSPKLKFTCQICKHLNEFYPFDSGIVSPLLLNTFTLQPGQAIFLDAGILHSYIQGAGIEIMANSDNVIRGGLTPKFINREILFAITRFETYLPQLIHPHLKINELVSYPTPAEEFYLSRLILEGTYILDNLHKPLLVFCFKGSFTTEDGFLLERGKAMFISFVERPVTLSGSADLFIASIP